MGDVFTSTDSDTTGSDTDTTATLTASDGADKINSGDGSDVVIAGAGDDVINAGDGDDTITGGAGDDLIKGGDGYDVAVYDGSVTDFISVDTDGDGINDALALRDGKGNSIVFATGTDDGTDTLKQIEALKFNDYTYHLDGTNNAVLAIDDTAIATEDEGRTNIDVLRNDVDLDGDALTITHIDGQAVVVGGTVILASGASVTLNADGTLDYQTNGQFEGLSATEQAIDVVSYTVTDGNGSTTTGELSVTIQGASDYTQGAGVDGYLVGASVFADADGDGVLDEGEAFDETDGRGGFSLKDASGDLVLRGGVDISTGLAFEGTLYAPEGSTAITALSTIVFGVLKPGRLGDVDNLIISGGLSWGLAKVHAAFGIDASVDILNIDPVAATLAGKSDGASLMSLSSQILNTVTQIVALMEGAGVEADTAEIFDTVFQQIAFDIREYDYTGTYNLTDPNSDQIANLIVDTALDLGVSLSVEITEGAAEVIAAANSQTQAALESGVTGEALLIDIAKVSIVTQGEVANALESAAGAGTVDAINDAVAQYSGDNLIAAIDKAEAGDVDGLEAHLSDGGFVVVWISFDASDPGVFGQRYDAAGNPLQRDDGNGGWENDEFRVSTSTTADWSAPSVTTLTDGGFVVTWHSSSGGVSGNDIYGRRFDASGNPVQREDENGNIVNNEFLINTETWNHQETPDITALADGGFLVTWMSLGHDMSDRGIYGQRFDSLGNAVQRDDGNDGLENNEFQIDSDVNNSQLTPVIAALADGGFVVAWESYTQDGSGYGVYGQRFDASDNPFQRSDGNGGLENDEFLINTETAVHQYQPSITALNDGGFVVAWLSYSLETNSNDIYGQRFDASGNPVQRSGSNGVLENDEFLINTETNGSQSSPDITALADGGFVVTWVSNDQDGSSYNIHGQRFGADGNPVQRDDGTGGLENNELLINTYTFNYQFHPAITALADGGFIITWSSLSQDGEGFGVYGQRFDSSGVVTGGEFPVNTTTPGDQNLSDVAGFTSLNSAPIAASDFAETGEDAGMVVLTFAELLNNDLDMDGDTISITAFDDAALPAGVSLQADFVAQAVTITYGDTYQSLSDGETTQLRFGYTLEDDLGATTPGTVNVIVTGTNDAPVSLSLADDIFTTGYNTGAVTDTLLSDGTPALLDSTDQNLSFLSRVRGMDAGDLDGDGDLDILTANDFSDSHVLLNDGNGMFTDAQNLGDGSQNGWDVALGDFDDDGDLDAYYAYWSSPDQLWQNDGTGNLVGTDNIGSRNSRAVEAGDVDGDGDLDLVVVNSTNSTGLANEVMLNDGSGNFTVSAATFGSDISYDLDLADVDGDGDLDAIVASWNDANHVYLNDGNGGFSDSGQVLGMAPTSAFSVIEVGDLNGDGYADVVITNNTAKDEVWLNNGDDTGDFTFNQYLGAATDDSFGLALADVDHDGDLDAYVNNNSKADYVWLNDGTGNFNTTPVSIDNNLGIGLTVIAGDFDGSQRDAGNGQAMTIGFEDLESANTQTGAMPLDYEGFTWEGFSFGETDETGIMSWANYGYRAVALETESNNVAVTQGGWDTTTDPWTGIKAAISHDSAFSFNGLVLASAFADGDPTAGDGTQPDFDTVTITGYLNGVLKGSLTVDVDKTGPLTLDFSTVGGLTGSFSNIDHVEFTHSFGWQMVMDDLQFDVAVAPDTRQTIDFEGLDSPSSNWGTVPSTYDGLVFSNLYSPTSGNPDIRFMETDEGFVSSQFEAMTDPAAGDNTVIYTASGMGLVIEAQSGDSFDLFSAEFTVNGDYETTLWVTGYDADGVEVAQHIQTINGSQAHLISFTGFDGVSRVEAATQSPDDPTPNDPQSPQEGNRQILLIDDITVSIDTPNIIDGTPEDDVLVGLLGADRFVFDLGDTGTDTIQNFNSAEGDQLDLSGMLSGIPGLDTSDVASIDTVLDFMFDGATTVIEVDTDGVVGAEQTIRLENTDITGNGSLSDFEIIENMWAENMFIPDAS